MGCANIIDINMGWDSVSAWHIKGLGRYFFINFLYEQGHS